MIQVTKYEKYLVQNAGSIDPHYFRCSWSPQVVVEFSEVVTDSVRNWDFFSLARGAVGLHNLMKFSLVLALFSLARPHFHWPRALGQLLRSHTSYSLVGFTQEL